VTSFQPLKRGGAHAFTTLLRTLFEIDANEEEKELQKNACKENDAQSEVCERNENLLEITWLEKTALFNFIVGE
jgi:hypothetical protein